MLTAETTTEVHGLLLLDSLYNGRITRILITQFKLSKKYFTLLLISLTSITVH